MKKHFLLALILSIGRLPLTAQILLNPPPDASVITVDVDLVNVLFSVRDKNGAYVKDLAKENFEIREDGRRQEIRHFAREVDTPLTVALLLDVSGSVANIIGTEKEAAGRFFSEVLRPGDKALLIGFAEMVAIWQDFTSSAGHLRAALDRAGPFVTPQNRSSEYRPRGGTLLYDAVKLVATQKLAKQAGRKTIILITDGLDNGSLVNLDAAGKAAQEADTVVYAIHYADDAGSSPAFAVRHAERNREGVSALQKLSEPTGGRTFHVSQKLPLEAVFEIIREEMRSQYGIGYKPPNRGTERSFHRLEVKISKPGLKVQARTGYYSTRGK